MELIESTESMPGILVKYFNIAFILNVCHCSFVFYQPVKPCHLNL